MGVRVFQPALIPLLGMYAPLFYIFFLSNSIRVNGSMRFQGGKEWRSRLLVGIANRLGLLLIILIQYLVFAVTGTVYWTDGWLYVNLLFAVIPMMFALPYFNRAFFSAFSSFLVFSFVSSAFFISVSDDSNSPNS